MRQLRKEVHFWSEGFGLAGSVAPLVSTRVILFGLYALFITAIDLTSHARSLGIEVTPFELAGGVLSVLLVLRTNAGYERWSEGRKLWGGIVNQSRNLAIASLSYGPDDPAWRDRIVRRTAAFAHAARLSLIGRRDRPELLTLLGPDDAAKIFAADHMPSAVARLIGESLRDARDRLGLDTAGILRIDPERATLIDHIGGCERIQKTPLPLAYRIEIRRVLIGFLGALPFALVDRTGWFTPAVTMLVAFPLLGLEQIGTELQAPFALDSLNRLPLEEICATIERNLLALLGDQSSIGR